jgi:hypothetical protein
VGGRDDDDVGVVKLQVRGLRILGSAPFGSFSIDIDNMVQITFVALAIASEFGFVPTLIHNISLGKPT